MAGQDDVITVQFNAMSASLDELAELRERLEEVVKRMDRRTREMQSDLLTIHGAEAGAVQQAVDRCKRKVPELTRLFKELADVMGTRQREYYRFHDIWKHQSSTVSFLVCYSTWLESGQLLSHADVEALLQLDHDKFGIDLEDYLLGLCSFSSELPRFVINRVTIGDYECPRRVAIFLNDFFAAFRKLNLRNDILRKRFDGIKYDLKKVEEVLYDVEIRGLSARETPPT